MNYVVYLSSVDRYSLGRLDTQLDLSLAQTDYHDLDTVADHDGFIFPSSKNQHLQLRLSKHKQDPAKESRHWLTPGLLWIIQTNQPSALDAHRQQPACSSSTTHDSAQPATISIGFQTQLS